MTCYRVDVGLCTLHRVDVGLCTLLPKGFSDFPKSVFFDGIVKQNISAFFNLLYKSSFRTRRSYTEYAVTGVPLKK
jgi:hypothetical protein